MHIDAVDRDIMSVSEVWICRAARVCDELCAHYHSCQQLCTSKYLAVL